MSDPAGNPVAVDPRAFRDALGAFPTGVAIMTTVDEDRRPVGLTCSSFNSVSLTPPLVVWSLSLTSRSLRAFQVSRRFAVHVLHAGQQSLCARFAAHAEDRFTGLDWAVSSHGTPDLGACAARFECRTVREHDGGDHAMFLGEVLELRTSDAIRPLVFHNGAFAELRTP